MKYLIIYEAFRSEVVSSLNKFLDKKIGKNKSSSFIRNLRSVQKRFNFPISEIKDEDIKYLPAKKALQIKAPEGWSPSPNYSGYDIYAFKFWFSLESGFLGETGIGSKEINYYDVNNKNFNERELDYIKNELGITKGELELVKDYTKLYHGQEVIGFFDSDLDFRQLSKAKIYIDGTRLYAIQEVASGNTPDGQDWRNWGTYSWTLGRFDSPGNDHHKLHIYKETKEELHLKDGKYQNSLDWNLPTDGTYLQDWRYSDNSLVEKADFCIVFYIDNLIKRGYKKASEYIEEREENRKEATALYSDDYIKHMNIKRYMSEIIDRMGIKVGSEVKDLKNLERVLKMSICGRFPIYSLLDRELNGLRFLEKNISSIYDIIKYHDGSILIDLTDRIVNKRRVIMNAKQFFNKAENKIFNSSNKSLIDLFNIIKEINDDITDYINKQEINTLSDLKSIYLKLEYIKKLFSDRYIGDLNCSYLLSYLYNDTIVDTYVDNKHDFTNDLKILNNIKRYISSILN